MRTLKLTHDEIAIIQRALGIAERQFNKARKDYLEQFVNIRGIPDLTETRKEADSIFALENKFCDLLLDIESGTKDI